MAIVKSFGELWSAGKGFLSAVHSPKRKENCYNLLHHSHKMSTSTHTALYYVALICHRCDWQPCHKWTRYSLLIKKNKNKNVSLPLYESTHPFIECRLQSWVRFNPIIHFHLVLFWWSETPRAATATSQCVRRRDASSSHCIDILQLKQAVRGLQK